MVDIKVGKHYQMIRKIGSGAFGEIFEGKKRELLNWLGKHITTKQPVAIKMVSRIEFKDCTCRNLSSASSHNLSMSTISTRCWKTEVRHSTSLRMIAEGISKVLWYGIEGDYRTLVIELLSGSLEDLF